jgi:ribosome biogenesis protein
MDDSPSRQIRIRFITKLLRPLRMSTTDFEIPADLSRMKLSDIVNRVLAVGEHWNYYNPSSPCRQFHGHRES